MRDHEQTELAPVETETAAVRAWGLAEDYEDDPPAARFNPQGDHDRRGRSKSGRHHGGVAGGVAASTQ